ncbi:MAG: hypothetical protein ACRDBM_08100, partial [Sporomusa sp.]
RNVNLEQKSTKRKQKKHQLRRKYKRYAAALAGAAIMTGAMLPGMPAAIASAAARPSTQPSSTVNYDKPTQNPLANRVIAERGRPDRNELSRQGWHEHRYSWPGANENQALYKDGKIYYRSDSNRYYTDNDHYLSNYAYSVGNPTDVVILNAATYGFNRYQDSFTLLTLTNNRAVVEVRKQATGKLFNVILERGGDFGWRIVRVQSL